ncbi:MAG TPA: hypothetical protein VJP81_01120 [Candidatus Dormibacteraeota bacterium]|nr:hypothetical protein [Candidatus Dormibacteraeota bacterium]
MLLADQGGKNPGQSQPDSNKTDGADHSNAEPNASCTPVTLAASPPSPQIAGVNVTLSGAATKCANAEYEFWILPPGGQWSVLRAFSETPTAPWHTTGLTAGTYKFDVWARHARSEHVLISPIANYILQVPPPAPIVPSVCSSVTWSTPSPVSPQVPGAKISLGATAAGCSNPLYQFWFQPLGGAWTTIRAYSPVATATWDTTLLAAGTYQLDVWVKESGSAASFEAEIKPYMTYSLQNPSACSSVTWSVPSPASPQKPGAMIALSATAAGCPNPAYQFWYQAQPNGTWTVIQAYGPASAALWNTASLGTGTYNLDVWVKDASSAAVFDAEIKPYLTYTLETGPPCATVTLTFIPVSPQAAGGKVQLDAVTTGCPDPTYEFWIQAPGGQWTIVQGFSTASGFVWDTTGLAPGAYLLDVWVRENGSSAPYEAHIAPNPTYTLT